jgi:hypothetical protein
MVCDAEMILMKVIPDDTMPVPGFERRTFMCSACHDVERHLAFVNPGRESDNELMPVKAGPPIADGRSDRQPTDPLPSVETAPSFEPTAAAAQDARIGAPGLLRRVVAKILTR